MFLDRRVPHSRLRDGESLSRSKSNLELEVSPLLTHWKSLCARTPLSTILVKTLKRLRDFFPDLHGPQSRSPLRPGDPKWSLGPPQSRSVKSAPSLPDLGFWSGSLDSVRTCLLSRTCSQTRGFRGTLEPSRPSSFLLSLLFPSGDSSTLIC